MHSVRAQLPGGAVGGGPDPLARSAVGPLRTLEHRPRRGIDVQCNRKHPVVFGEKSVVALEQGSLTLAAVVAPDPEAVATCMVQPSRQPVLGGHLKPKVAAAVLQPPTVTSRPAKQIAGQSSSRCKRRQFLTPEMRGARGRAARLARRQWTAPRWRHTNNTAAAHQPGVHLQTSLSTLMAAVALASLRLSALADSFSLGVVNSTASPLALYPDSPGFLEG